jgi:hypothetical protein
VTAPGDVDPEVLDRLRPICGGLPETYEEPAWVGTRWRIRRRTFAHVLTVDPDRQAVLARAAALDRPAGLLVFRSPLDEIAGLLSVGHPHVQVGNRGVEARWVRIGSVSVPARAVTDITPTVHRVRERVRAGDEQAATHHLPVERPYPLPAQIAARLGATGGG